MSPGHKKQMVRAAVGAGLCSGRAGCRILRLARITFWYRASQRSVDGAVEADLRMRHAGIGGGAGAGEACALAEAGGFHAGPDDRRGLPGPGLAQLLDGQ